MTRIRSRLTNVPQEMREVIGAYLDNPEEDRQKLADFINTRLVVDDGKEKLILYDPAHHIFNIADQVYDLRTRRLKKILTFSSMTIELEGLCWNSMKEFHKIKRLISLIRGVTPNFQPIEVKCEGDCSEFPCDRRIWISKVYRNCKYCNDSDIEYELPDI